MVTLFEEEKDWKEFLTDDARETLESLFASMRKHKGAYTRAENEDVAQLWSALIEIHRDLVEIKEMLGKLAEPWKAVVAVGEAEKKRAIERIVSDIIKPTDMESQEATRKLVESLMKF